MEPHLIIKEPDFDTVSLHQQCQDVSKKTLIRVDEKKFKSMIVKSESVALEKRKMETTQTSDNHEPFEDLSQSEKSIVPNKRQNK